MTYEESRLREVALHHAMNRDDLRFVKSETVVEQAEIFLAFLVGAKA